MLWTSNSFLYSFTFSNSKFLFFTEVSHFITTDENYNFWARFVILCWVLNCEVFICVLCRGLHISYDTNLSLLSHCRALLEVAYQVKLWRQHLQIHKIVTMRDSMTRYRILSASAQLLLSSERMTSSIRCHGMCATLIFRRCYSNEHGLTRTKPPMR